MKTTETKDTGRENGGKVLKFAKETLKDERVLSGLESDLAKVLVSLQKSPKWQEYVLHRWKDIDPQRQAEIYDEGRPTKQMMVNAALMNNPGFVYLVKGREFMEAPVWRYLVQAGLVDRPESVTEDQIKNDLVKDGKVFEKLLYVIEVVLAIFAPEAIPELQTAKTIIIQIMSVRRRVAERTRGANVLEEGAIAA